MKNAPEGSFGHTGFTGTSIVAVPDKKISVILLINRQNTGLNEKGEYYNVTPLRMKVFSYIMQHL
jgi:CubicO group peptidase (beta-lactamase class C family)